MLCGQGTWLGLEYFLLVFLVIHIKVAFHAGYLYSISIYRYDPMTVLLACIVGML